MGSHGIDVEKRSAQEALWSDVENLSILADEEVPLDVEVASEFISEQLEPTIALLGEPSVIDPTTYEDFSASRTSYWLSVDLLDRVNGLSPDDKVFLFGTESVSIEQINQALNDPERRGIIFEEILDLVRSVASYMVKSRINEFFNKGTVKLKDIKQWQTEAPRSFDLTYDYFLAQGMEVEPNPSKRDQRKPNDLTTELRRRQRDEKKEEKWQYTPRSEVHENRLRSLELVEAQKSGVFIGSASARSQRLFLLSALCPTPDSAAHQFVADLPVSKRLLKIAGAARDVVEGILLGEPQIVEVEAVCTACDVYDTYLRVDAPLAALLFQAAAKMVRHDKVKYTKEVESSAIDLVLNAGEILFDVDLDDIDEDDLSRKAIDLVAGGEEEYIEIAEKQIQDLLQDDPRTVLFAITVIRLSELDNITDAEGAALADRLTILMEEDLMDPAYYTTPVDLPAGVIGIGDLHDARFTCSYRFALSSLCTDISGSLADLYGYGLETPPKFNYGGQVARDWFDTEEAKKIRSVAFLPLPEGLSTIGAKVASSSREMLKVAAITNLRESFLSRLEVRPHSPYPISFFELLPIDLDEVSTDAVIELYISANEVFMKVLREVITEEMKQAGEALGHGASRSAMIREAGAHLDRIRRDPPLELLEGILTTCYARLGIERRPLSDLELAGFREYFAIVSDSEDETSDFLYYLVPSTQDEVQLIQALFGSDDQTIPGYSHVPDSFITFEHILSVAEEIFQERAREVAEPFHKRMIEITVRKSYTKRSICKQSRRNGRDSFYCIYAWRTSVN